MFPGVARFHEGSGFRPIPAQCPSRLSEPFHWIIRVATHLHKLPTRRPPPIQRIATLSRPILRVERAQPPRASPRRSSNALGLLRKRSRSGPSALRAGGFSSKDVPPISDEAICALIAAARQAVAARPDSGSVGGLRAFFCSDLAAAEPASLCGVPGGGTAICRRWVNSGSSPPCARRAVTCWRHQIGPLIQREALTRLL
jgi:hypothetical protein